jgi:hypothetical protein
VLQIAGAEDGGHAATADLGFDGVAVGECRAEAVEQISHALAASGELF